MRTLALAVLALIPSGALAQTCTPTLRGFQAGPIDLNPNITSFVGAMTAFDDGDGNALYAAGLFAVPPTGSTAFPCNVARYREGVWAPMNTGLPLTTSQAMRALARIDLSGSGGPGLSLYAGGDSGAIYRWAGSAWAAAGSVGGTCYSLLPYSDAAGPVLLAGSGNGVLAWRGSGAWDIYEGLSGSGAVYALRLVDDGSGPALFAIGAFRDQARGLNYIAKLVNGAWAPYPINLPTIQSFSDFTSYDDGVHGPELYIAGTFNTQSTANPGVVRLSNSVWSIVATPLSTDPSALGPNLFKVDEGQGEQMYVGGVFSSTGVGLARLTPSGWQTTYLSRSASSRTYPSGSVRSVARFDDGSGMKTYFGGTFSGFRTDDSEQTPLTPAFGLMRSGASGLESTAQGLGEDPSQLPTAYDCSLSVVDLGQGPRLFAGGRFSRAGGRFARSGALFDGAAWTPLSLPTSGPSGQAIEYGVVATIAGQQRLVSHLFNSSLGPVGYWDGSQWVRMSAQPPVSVIYAMAVYNGTIYVLSDPGLYRYDGTSWVLDIAGFPGGSAMVVGDIGRGGRLYVAASGPLGQGLYEHDGTIYTRRGTNFTSYGSALAIHDDGGGPMLYVAAGGIPGYIGRLEDNVFVPIVRGGFGFAGPQPLVMTSFHDGRSPALYIAGNLISAGGSPSNGLARWHAGVVTSPTPYVPQANVQGLWRASLAVHGNRLYIAGDFYNIGGVGADHLAYIEACPRTCSADFNYDGDIATDADIEAFFACLAGNCCPNCGSADFNGDGEVGNDADIESFFRVLAGGAC